MSPREQVAAVAQAMLAGDVHLQDGCREICGLRFQLSNPEQDDKDLMLLVGIDSELDDCPVGPVRQHWEPEALAGKDRQRDAYLHRLNDHLLTACRALATWR